MWDKIEFNIERKEIKCKSKKLRQDWRTKINADGSVTLYRISDKELANENYERARINI